MGDGVDRIDSADHAIRKWAGHEPRRRLDQGDGDGGIEALDIFGRGGKTLLPLFNEGAEGIRAMRREFQELGGAFTDEGAAAGIRAAPHPSWRVDCAPVANDANPPLSFARVAPSRSAAP